jgi:F0F1-type ATP synthase delta subunit
MAPSSSHHTLPASLISKADLMRLVREIGALDDQFSQQELQQRAQGNSTQSSVLISNGLRQVADNLRLDIATHSGRLNAKEAITGYLEKAPLFHISFASEPPVDQLQRIVEWLRQNIHGLAVVQTVVQPAIIAGCIIRSSNKVFDFSVRESFKVAAPQLLNEVRAL